MDESLCIDTRLLVKLAQRLQDGYRPAVPFHNALHAANVLLMTHTILDLGEVMEDLAGVEGFHPELALLACYFAAAAHDYQHPGLNNSFLVETEDPIATQYNDQSVLENYHLGQSLKLLRQSDSNILSALSAKDAQYVRHVVIDMVLATDLSRHRHHLTKFVTLPERQVTAEGAVSILEIVLKCADIGHVCLPWEQHYKQACLLQEEMFRQGDKEKELGMDFL